MCSTFAVRCARSQVRGVQIACCWPWLTITSFRACTTALTGRRINVIRSEDPPPKETTEPTSQPINESTNQPQILGACCAFNIVLWPPPRVAGCPDQRQHPSPESCPGNHAAVATGSARSRFCKPELLQEEVMAAIDAELLKTAHMNASTSLARHSRGGFPP